MEAGARESMTRMEVLLEEMQKKYIL